ncbi:hypothetical protein D3C86_2065780 [compost metagenome]
MLTGFDQAREELVAGIDLRVRLDQALGGEDGEVGVAQEEEDVPGMLGALEGGGRDQPGAGEVEVELPAGCEAVPGDVIQE